MIPVKNLEEAKLKLRTMRTTIREEFSIDIFGIIGSFARGDYNDKSDIDLAFRIAGKPTLFDLAGASIDLKKELLREIDLVDVENMPKIRRDFIMRDFIEI